MTWGFLASFGGLVLAMALLLLWERFYVRGGDATGAVDDAEIAAALDRAQAAMRKAESELDLVRLALPRR